MLFELTEDNLQDIVSENQKVIVQFGATWCGACKVMKPKVKRHAEENEDVKFGYADAEHFTKSREITTIKNLPTCVGIVNGEVIAKEVGSKPSNLAELVETVKNS